MTTSFPPISYPSKPVPPFTAEPPRNQFPGFFPDMWKNITGKPYITVSSKGLANGLSEYFNDGADFGPDSLQADGSLTQTSGIQEAIDYAGINKTKIVMTHGVFNVTAPFRAYSAGSSYGQILLPYNSSPSSPPPSTPNPIFIEIEGFGGIYGDANGSGTTDGLPVPTGGTVIYFQPPSTPSSTTIGEYSGIDGGDNSISNYVILKMNKVTLRQNPNPRFANMQLSALANVDLDQIRSDIYYSINGNPSSSSDFPPTPTYVTGVGIVYLDNNGVNNRAWGSYRNISAVGYYYGHVIQSSTNVFYSNIYSLYCEYGLYSVANPTGQMNTIYNYTTQFCAYSIYFMNNYASAKGNLSIHHYRALTASNFVTDIDSPSDTTGFIQVSSNEFVSPTTNASGIYIISSRVGGPYIGTTAGTTAGTINQIQYLHTNYYSKYIFVINGYENDTTTNQTIDFFTGFNSFAGITANTTGLTILTTTSGITITAPDSTTTYSGIVIIEGY